MKAELIFSLFQSVRQLGGVGEKRYEAYKRLHICSIRDLIYHLPVDRVDRRNEPPLYSIYKPSVISQVVQVDQIIPSSRNAKNSPTRILCSNATGSINLVYFHAAKDFITSAFPVGKKIAISGKAEKNYGNLDMLHPDIITEAANINIIKRVEPVYPLTYGLTSRYLGNTIANSLRRLPSLPEWLDESMLKKHGWPSWREALDIVHYQVQDKLAYYAKARERLAYDEILAQQLCLRIARGQIKTPRKQPLNFSDELRDRFIAQLPFALTSEQKKVISEITADQRSDKRMFRLLQGDVGSGKTIVAFCAMLNAIAAGKQAALMVPTEILARQHYKKLAEIAAAYGLKSALLISATKNAEKEQLKEQLRTGELNLIVGTHALLREKVEFHDLALVVIDEQHRFGVEQRLTLVDKGKDADYLMMTATPIPRTLAMVGFGDIDISTIREKPVSRQEIATSIVKISKLDEVVVGLKRLLEQGDKVYWVCPLVEESEKLVLANAKARFEWLNEQFPGVTGLVHGQMSPSERDANMQKFIDSEFKILVSTTVIEVGVDVSDASVMVIENAERFGLTQLHQLRGRVGRGDKKSYCVLLTGSTGSQPQQDAKAGGQLDSNTKRCSQIDDGNWYKSLGQISYLRLAAMKQSNDGFDLAEKDLEFRGGGELLGTKQSGIPDFRVYDIFNNKELIPLARAEAQEVFALDPQLTSARGRNLQILLHLFEMDKNLSLIETCR